jgi:hypothetical protein
MPVEHYMGRLSQEFGGALPTAIAAEQHRLPVGFLEQVIEYRAYAAAYQTFRSHPTAEGELVNLARQIEAALVQEEIDQDG